MTHYLTKAARDRAFLKSIWDITRIAEELQSQHLAELCIQITRAYYAGDEDGKKSTTRD